MLKSDPVSSNKVTFMVPGVGVATDIITRNAFVDMLLDIEDVKRRVKGFKYCRKLLSLPGWGVRPNVLLCKRLYSLISVDVILGK